jgi:hypothetical protein
MTTFIGRKSGLKQFLQSSILLFHILLLLTGCGYHWGNDPLSVSRTIVQVPYIEGDYTGEYTAALIHAITADGVLEYRRCDAPSILQVTILDWRENEVGFRYDRNKQEQITKTLVPAEMRLSVLAEVNLIDSNSGKVVIGPAKICASVEFDHEYYSSREGVNVFSLGQVTDLDTAMETITPVLAEALATKIVDFITNTW